MTPSYNFGDQILILSLRLIFSQSQFETKFETMELIEDEFKTGSLFIHWFMVIVFRIFVFMYLESYKKKITRRTTTSERNKFLQVIASFRKKVTDCKSQITNHR